MAREIFKFQRPIASNEKHKPPILAYNRDRSKMFHVKLDWKSECKVFGSIHVFKIFRYAEEFEGVLQIVFDEELPDQGW